MSKPTHISEGAVARADSLGPSIDLHIALRDAYDRQRFSIVAANKLMDAGLVAGMPADDAFEAMMWAGGGPTRVFVANPTDAAMNDHRFLHWVFRTAYDVRQQRDYGEGEVLDPVLVMPGVGKPGNELVHELARALAWCVLGEKDILPFSPATVPLRAWATAKAILGVGPIDCQVDRIGAPAWVQNFARFILRMARHTGWMHPCGVDDWERENPMAAWALLDHVAEVRKEQKGVRDAWGRYKLKGE